MRLVNGDTVQGWGIALSQGVLELDSRILGKLKVPKDQIAQVTTRWPVWVVFSDRRMTRGAIVAAGPELMAVEVGGDLGKTDPFAMSQVETIASGEIDPIELRKRWKTSGGINLGTTIATGNTESEYFHADGQLTLRREDTRYTGRGEANYRKERRNETENNARLSLKHDRFFTERWFFYTTGGFEFDKQRDLNLRADLGTGTGYQVYETDRSELSVEGGLSYIIEDYSNTPDNSYPALRWSTDFRYDPVIRRIRFFHFHEIFSDLAGGNGMNVRTKTGVRYFVFEGFNATGQINFDWDSDPASGNKESDITYLITLGYAW